MFDSLPMRRLIEEGYVAPHPETARERIRTRFSCELTQSGRDCPGIALLRYLIQSLDSDLRFARGLFITAAHTHWGDGEIVISFDPGRNIFLSGPTAAGGTLCPFSFVFSAGGPVPYEWADRSVPVGGPHLDELYAFIGRLNELVVASVADGLPIPLGVTINHRFKRSVWDQQVFSFAEGPHDEENGRAVVRPVVESIVNAKSQYPDQVQVAWSAFPNAAFRYPELTDDEAEECLRLESLLRKLNPQDAVAFMNDLQAYLQVASSGPIPAGRGSRQTS